jgi:hypothetical protein
MISSYKLMENSRTRIEQLSYSLSGNTTSVLAEDDILVLPS